MLDAGKLNRLAISMASIGLRTSLKASRTSKARPTDLTTEFSPTSEAGVLRIDLLYTADMRCSAE